MSLRKDSGITEIKGVGTKTAELLYKKQLYTVWDLINYYPRDYEYFTEPVPADQIQTGSGVCRLTVLGNGSTVRAGGMVITSFRGADPTGELRITFYNMPYIQKSLKPGITYVFRGQLRQYKNGNFQLMQPKVYSPEEYEKLQGRLLPVYSLPGGMKMSQLRKITEKICREYPEIPDYLTERELQQLELMGEDEAVRRIHYPEDREQMIGARNRRVFDEFLTFLLSVRRQKDLNSRIRNENPFISCADTVRFLEKLPYELTGAQKRAWKEIEEDLTGPYVMNRLLQGDVGSGKTVIAFLSLLLCAANGHQGALMAPTEVLAVQHMEDLCAMIREYSLPLKPVLLTGSVTGKARKETYEQIRSGQANVIIGTHALIQDAVEYRDLALVITDEQHRFGVRQREDLAGKGRQVPVLVMSATPIPRTLAIILYGDLNISVLDEMPASRLPIKNLAMEASEGREKACRFLIKQIRAGRQGYIVCPAVEEGELEGIENVTDYTARLTEKLPADISVASLNGKMKSSEKNRIMNEFASGRIDVLVSTTVIEVGINVPNAAVMIIENAERFGLSQLHQLRGRVGRGKEQSYCIFLYSEGENDGSGIKQKPKRLQILEQSNDGFHIASEDLKLRGPGDLFGIRQSGEMGFELADIYEDAGILKKASAFADEILGRDPDFQIPGAKQIDFRSI